MIQVLNNLLSDVGYNVISLPKEDVAPLTLLSDENGFVSSLECVITEMFVPFESLPPGIEKDRKVNDIAGKTSVSYEAGGGVSVLDWLLEKLNLGKLAANAKLDRDYTLTISYENVLEDKINLLQLDNFISGSKPNSKKFTTFQRRLEDGELFVINSVLKSNSFNVTIQSKDGGNADIGATIKGIVDIKGNVTMNRDNSITIENKKAVPLAFAFKAQRILYNKKAWWEVFKEDEAKFTIKNETGIVYKNESDFPTVAMEAKRDKAFDV